MENTEELPIILDPPDYKKAFEKNKTFSIQFPFYTPDVEIVFMKILNRFLGRHNLLYMKDMLITVIRELITNAVKANFKRLYFMQKNLNIENIDDYRTGMENFKHEVYGKDSNFLEQFKDNKLDLHVRVTFDSGTDSLKLSILNNTRILGEELKKIRARIKKAYSYRDLSDAFDDVLDDSEGAGLGLIIAMMLFKNANLPEDTFSISSVKGGTVTTIKLPPKAEQLPVHKKIAEEILKEVEKIPSFPENILEIQRLCGNPESTIREIADRIKMDPGLTTAILKLANSAGFITLKKTKTIEEAIMLIGLKTVNMLLLATGAQKIIESRYKKAEDIWKNSYRTAFYANQIALKKKHSRLGELAYLSTLLADIGKIVLLSIKPEITGKIQEIAGNKENISSNILEEITIGIDHATLGSLICRHWNFDDMLVQVIEYHHRPYLASPKNRMLMDIVNLAYHFSEIEDRKSRFETIDDELLEKFDLKEKNDFIEFHDRLKNAYSNQYTS